MWQVLLIILLFLLAYDWYQTYQISIHPEKWYETNPFLGLHPPPRLVHIYFTCTIICTIIIILAIPEPWKSIGAGGFALVEAWFVWSNRKLGIL